MYFTKVPKAILEGKTSVEELYTQLHLYHSKLLGQEGIIVDGIRIAADQVNEPLEHEAVYIPSEGFMEEKFGTMVLIWSFLRIYHQLRMKTKLAGRY